MDFTDLTSPGEITLEGTWHPRALELYRDHVFIPYTLHATLAIGDVVTLSIDESCFSVVYRVIAQDAVGYELEAMPS